MDKHIERLIAALERIAAALEAHQHPVITVDGQISDESTDHVPPPPVVETVVPKKSLKRSNKVVAPVTPPVVEKAPEVATTTTTIESVRAKLIKHAELNGNEFTTAILLKFGPALSKVPVEQYPDLLHALDTQTAIGSATAAKLDDASPFGK
jgi:hypothetical protein